jgi:hypothetical protein
LGISEKIYDEVRFDIFEIGKFILNKILIPRVLKPDGV